MSDTVSGFRYWQLHFSASGDREGGVDEFLAECPGTQIRDLFVMCHGWNNAPDRARRLYERYFAEVAKFVPNRHAVAVAGLVWPSMRWPDEGDPEADTESGGAATFGGQIEPARSDRELVASLKAVFEGQDNLLDELGALLDERPDDAGALSRFQQLLRELASAPESAELREDNQERDLLEGRADVVFKRAAAQTSDRGAVQQAAAGFEIGGAAGGDLGGAAFLGFGRLWEGAKQALRQTTYWEMKKRAGQVGTFGLGPLIGELHARAPDLRIHLIGHSFGARLVSFSLQGLGATPPSPSPVKSLFLIQGAFSHYAFARHLPHAPDRSGWLAGMQARVEGPVVVTHSVHDLAVGRLYPAASLPAGQDAAGLDEWAKRWQAIGHDGAQEVDARAAPLGEPGTRYDIRVGQFLNLDGDAVIRRGGPPSGAHSDIFHPALAWAGLVAAGLVAAT